jgi:hypothetical protein
MGNEEQSSSGGAQSADSAAASNKVAETTHVEFSERSLTASMQAMADGLSGPIIEDTPAPGGMTQPVSAAEAGGVAQSDGGQSAAGSNPTSPASDS